MKTSRVVIKNCVLDFSLGGAEDFLAITVDHGPAGAVVFGWTPESSFRVVKIVRDPSTRLEAQEEAQLSDFPLEETSMHVESALSNFSPRDSAKILAVLKSAAAEPNTS